MTLNAIILRLSLAIALIVATSSARADVVDKNQHAAEIARACERLIATFRATLDRNGMVLDGTNQPASSFGIPTCRHSAYGKQLIANAHDPKRIALIEQEVARLGREGYAAQINSVAVAILINVNDINRIHPSRNWNTNELRVVLGMIESAGAAQALVSLLRR